MRFCQQADLERSLGGAAQLTQLLDKDGDNQPDADLVDNCIDAASNELASYIEPTVQLSALAAPYPFTLVSKTADCAAFYAWRYGGYGQPAPEGIIQGHESAVRWAQDVGAKRAGLGSLRAASLAQPTGVRDYDELGTGISINAMKRGFR